MHGGCFSKLLGSKATCIFPTVAIVWTSLTLYLIQNYSNCAIVFLKAQFWVCPLAFINPWPAPSPGIFEMTFLLMMLLSILAPPLCLIQWVKLQLDLSFSLWQKEIMYDCLSRKDKIHIFFSTRQKLSRCGRMLGNLKSAFTYKKCCTWEPFNISAFEILIWYYVSVSQRVKRGYPKH